MDFALGYAEELDAAHRDALARAIVTLTDSIHDDLVALAKDPRLTVEDTDVGARLPDRYAKDYTYVDLRKLLVAVTVLGRRLADPAENGILTCCVGEELALHLLIDEATVWLQLEEPIEPHFGDFISLATDDADIEWIFTPAGDGIEDWAGEHPEAGIADMRPAEWFAPFEGRHVHPYLLS